MKHAITLGFALFALQSSPAWGWGSPEHKAFGQDAYTLARAVAVTRGYKTWTVTKPEDTVGDYSTEPDNCHSFWHAPITKTTSNGAGGTIRPIPDPAKPPVDCDRL